MPQDGSQTVRPACCALRVEEGFALTCKIVGHGWHADRLPGRDPRIEMIGEAPDLDDVFDTVRLTVAPLRFGAGIKGKVLDSFAAGLPCVMTPIAAEGLALTGALPQLVAGDPAGLADIILRLHADPASATTSSIPRSPSSRPLGSSP